MRLFLCIFFGLSLAAWAEEEKSLVMITEQGAGSIAELKGNVGLLTKKVTPASTFKIIIAWAALEEGLVKPEDRHMCRDSYVPDTPRELDLHEALYYSSNDYFAWLAEKLGRERLEKYVKKSPLAGALGRDSEALAGDLKEAAHGGGLQVMPVEQHAMAVKLAEGKLADSPEVMEKLKKALRWPCSEESVSLHGKTGTWQGASWYNGWGVSKDGKWKAVTVFTPYTPPDWKPVRDHTVGQFYGVFGQKPQP